MLTVFNRRKLVMVPSQQRYFQLKQLLQSAGISCATKMREPLENVGKAHYRVDAPQEDDLYRYTIYVHRDDYDRALAAIRPALTDAENTES